MPKYRGPYVHRGVRFALFATSYAPLFLLLIVRQLIDNIYYLKWGGLSTDAIVTLVSKFGLSIFVGVLMALGLVALWQSLRNLKETTETNGSAVTVLDVRNRNAEAVGYIGTYIIPFLFQNMSGVYATVAVAFLLFVVYSIYVNSTLLLVNPILSFWYSLYEIEYVVSRSGKESGPRKNGMIIIKDKYLEDMDTVLLMKIGPKLYFGVRDAS